MQKSRFHFIHFNLYLNIYMVPLIYYLNRKCFCKITPLNLSLKSTNINLCIFNNFRDIWQNMFSISNFEGRGIHPFDNCRQKELKLVKYFLENYIFAKFHQNRPVTLPVVLFWRVQKERDESLYDTCTVGTRGLWTSCQREELIFQFLAPGKRSFSKGERSSGEV